MGAPARERILAQKKKKKKKKGVSRDEARAFSPTTHDLCLLGGGAQAPASPPQERGREAREGQVGSELRPEEAGEGAQTKGGEMAPGGGEEGERSSSK